jgi:hypothetical protein
MAPENTLAPHTYFALIRRSKAMSSPEGHCDHKIHLSGGRHV